jgi:hypothetical protein
LVGPWRLECRWVDVKADFRGFALLPGLEISKIHSLGACLAREVAAGAGGIRPAAHHDIIFLEHPAIEIIWAVNRALGVGLGITARVHPTSHPEVIHIRIRVLMVPTVQEYRHTVFFCARHYRLIIALLIHCWLGAVTNHGRRIIIFRSAPRRGPPRAEFIPGG